MLVTINSGDVQFSKLLSVLLLESGEPKCKSEWWDIEPEYAYLKNSYQKK